MLASALRELSALLGSRAATAPDAASAARANQLRGHVDEFLLPRTLDLDAPLLVVILGSTGSGKSSLFNAIAGEALSEVGVLRPTTRIAHALAPPQSLLPPALDRLADEGLVEIIRREAGWENLVVVDAPDFDSVEAANRALAIRLLEAADLLIFVTTDTRYADEIPWTVLARARERGVPLLTLINRLPSSHGDRESVVNDYRRLLDEGGIGGLSSSQRLEVVGVDLGAVEREIDGLDRQSVEPVVKTLHRLMSDDEERRALARQSLLGALTGLPQSIEEIVGELDEEAATRQSLLETADGNYLSHRAEISQQIDRGSFLRTEVLREWQEFVGANRVARIISEGVGKMAAAIRAAFKPGPPPPAREVKEAALADLTALVVSHSDQAAAETSSAWARSPSGAEALADDPDLWGAAPELPAELERSLASWSTQLSLDIMELGEKRRGIAKAASLGVNVLGTGAILAVFAQTGGLTGAEAGIAAVTAVVNQTLLEAIFGEANVARFVADARELLDQTIDEAIARDLGRFEHTLRLSPDAGDLAAALRITANEIAKAAGE